MEGNEPNTGLDAAQPDESAESILNQQLDPAEGSENTKRKSSLGRTLGSIVDGTFLTRQNMLNSIPFFFFLALLGVIYISNIYYAEKMVRQIEQTKRELKELRYEHITTKAELMYLSKQSEVARRLKATGLQETTSPPEKIVAPAVEPKK